jgi:hypothetical protein
LRDFLKKLKSKPAFIIKPKITQEGCLFAVELIMDELNEKELNQYQNTNLHRDENATILISKEIFQFFPEINEIEIDLQKGIKKKPVITFPKPIVEQRCKKK